MIYQDHNQDEIRRLFKEMVEQQKCLGRIIEANQERRKSFSQMIKVKVHHSLQDQWLNEDRARYYEWLDKKMPFGFKSIPFEEWLAQKTGGQFFPPAKIKIRPKKIVETAEEKPRPLVVSVETESVVGLEERVQVFESKIDLENDSSTKYSNDEQGQDTILDVETTPIDMIICDKADIKKSYSAKLFELKAEIGEIIMPRGHNNCSTHSAVENEKYFSKLEIFGENSLFGLERNQVENFNIKISWLGIKHRWPSPVYDSATFLSLCQIIFLTIRSPDRYLRK